MHEELRGVDEDLVSAVSDWAVPPRTLKSRQKNNGMDENVENIEGKKTTTRNQIAIHMFLFRLKS